MEFNHAAGQVAIDRMSDAVALFVDHLGFEEVFKMDGTGASGAFEMAVLRQPGTNVDVQLTGLVTIEPQARKHMSQFGFASDDLNADRQAIEAWCEARGLATTIGEYMPGFLWVDVPEVFLDFVIEVMDRKALLETGYRFPAT